MLPDERRQYLLERLRQDGKIIAKDLSQELELSEDTIRRDLRELAQEGLLQRVHGGALPASPALVNYKGRETVLPEAKIAVGRAAAHMVQNGNVIILDGGTTAVQVAKHLPRDIGITVVTHSPSIALELVEHPGADIILIGGRLFKHSIVSVGATTIEAIQNIQADLFFMGVTGVHHEVGLSTGDYEEAKVKAAFSRQAADTFVLASSEKIGAASPYIITQLNTVAGIIVDQSATEQALMPFQKIGVNIVFSE